MSDERLLAGTAALASPIRLRLYRLMVKSGAAGSGPVALAAAAGLERNLVSYHLQPLVAAGLVRSERRGRDVNYRVEPAELHGLATKILNLSGDAAERWIDAKGTGRDAPTFPTSGAPDDAGRKQ